MPPAPAVPAEVRKVQAARGSDRRVPRPERRPRFDYARVLHDPVGLQRAVALAAILGPCRALAPYGSDETQ